VADAFSARARAFGTYIVAGTVLNRREDGKIYNTALLFDRNGAVAGQYDKIHLFDALNAADGEQESHYCQAGDHLFVGETDFGKIGVVVCYDIRFPELARSLALRGVKFLLVPAAFYSPRFDHWTELIRAAALHNSMYVLGANLFGAWNPANKFCGRSLLADPWGVVVAAASDTPAFFQAYVDADYPDQIRNAIGSFHNRRPALYDIPKE
jgi:predicted amidohydrolase